jgi:glucosylceramidase
MARIMLLSLIVILIANIVSNAQQMDFWLTDPDAKVLFQQQPSISPNSDNRAANDIINIIESQKYQTIDGFGYTLTGGSALLLHNLDDATRAQILQELFNTDKNNIGVSYLRLSIGASDLDEKVFSYDDLPSGQTDVDMTRFDLGYDRLYLIPILKEILAINPNIKLMGSPWSPPVWMKSNKNSVGGTLLTEYYDAYALYFVRYIQEMKKEGITIDAITIQNEPLHPGNNPSLLMVAPVQAQFIKQSLGPAFRKNSITTKIIVYDHNADHPDYPVTVLKDPDAKQYVDGSAFHLYAGSIDALSSVHDQFPEKNLYFTEQWVGAPGNLKGDLGWHVKNLIVGASRNWARTVIEWNLAADSKLEPHTPGGCTQCLGAITIDGKVVATQRNPAYYIIAHAAKFVRPNSIRIASNVVSGLPNVAFQRPNDMKKVLVVLNDNNSGKTAFQIQCNGKVYDTSLNGGSVGTYIC